MITIRLMLDYDEGPVWPNHSDPVTFERSTGVEKVDNDEIINELASRMSELYDDCYEFESHDVACWFNKEKFIEEKDVILDLLKQLISRLNELNDGAFSIDDKITEMYDCDIR